MAAAAHLEAAGCHRGQARRHDPVPLLELNQLASRQSLRRALMARPQVHSRREGDSAFVRDRIKIGFGRHCEPACWVGDGGVDASAFRRAT